MIFIQSIGRNFFPDGSVVDLTADAEMMQEQMASYRQTPMPNEIIYEEIQTPADLAVRTRAY